MKLRTGSLATMSLAVIAFTAGCSRQQAGAPPPRISPEAVPATAGTVQQGALPDSMPPEMRAQAEAARQSAIQNQLDNARKLSATRSPTGKK